ncbi:hypothetical protein EYF80_040530 [Liparis tanakae]|uniref:Uncharacterized protein n=1 Tax=Liparis tanakae TaxID=230148 RepID=A0A4Z2G9N6_9TELE|nr:hypothetical protein EYF80_040530 [Liparis tanakae]
MSAGTAVLPLNGRPGKPSKPLSPCRKTRSSALTCETWLPCRTLCGGGRERERERERERAAQEWYKKL